MISGAKQKLTVLHIARIADIPQSGVAVVVPQYVEEQSVYANVALLNIRDFTPKGYEKKSKLFFLSELRDGIESLPKPFSRPDLVVFHEVYWPEFLKVSRSLRKLKIPYIITPHVSLTDTAQRNKFIKKMIGNLFFFNSFIKNAKAIQYLTVSEKDQTSRYADLPYFIRSNGIRPIPHAKSSFNKDSLDIVYVGRFDYRIKGLDRIIDAVNLIQEEMREYSIKVTLRGTDQQNSLEKMQSAISSYGVEDLVSVGDGLFGTDKVDTILSNDCFIQLSRTEGQPLGIIEAMALGMPCIITEGTTFYNVAKEFNAGIPVSDNPASIAQTILDIRLGKYDLKMISRNASLYVDENLSWKTVGVGMIKDYIKILSVKG